MELKLPKKKYITEDNLKRIVKVGISFGERLNSIESACIEDFSESKNYLRGDACYKDGYIYRAKVSTTGAWVESRWTKVGDEFTELTKADIEAMLNLSQEELDNLQKLLKDDQITTTSTFSSSKIYSDLQAAIETAKEYTNEQTGKCVKPAYKVVASTSEVTETGYFYLISNGTNFDMYVLSADGTAVSLGTSEIDLSDYAKLTDLNNYYDKSTSDGKFATITTVNSKVDKTDIVDNLTSTDTDKPLSANQGKVLKDEVDLIKANDSNVVKKTDIVTTIDKTSTDEQVPSASTIYNKSKNKIADLPNGTNIIAYADSISNETVADTVRIMNAANSPYKAVGIGSDFYYTIYNIADDGYKRIVAYDIRKNDMYMILKHSGTWGTWRKLCSTNIKDVPVTTITNTLASTKVSLSNSDSYATYYVKNGTCYVTIWSMTILAACSVETIFNDIPKSAIGVTCPLCNGEESFAQVFISPNSKVIAFNASAATINKNGYCSLSYPVAES